MTNNVRALCSIQLITYGDTKHAPKCMNLILATIFMLSTQFDNRGS